jgi:hypothetical protein
MEKVNGNLLFASTDRKYIPYASIDRKYISVVKENKFSLHANVWVFSITLKLV